jgi:Mrp family chromosome partitioning ATPase
MSESCNGCASAGSCSSFGTGECGNEDQNRYEPLNSKSEVKEVIAIVSGKGGVGKSLVTSLMAVIMQRRGYHTAILDADITGPSIPKTFKLTDKASASEEAIFPVTTKTGIQVMSINLLLNDTTDPVLWRGPVIAGTVKQFWSDVLWTGVDYMFVDMPPGTGDVPLTVFQSIPIKGIIVVTSPQDLVGMIVEKAVKMADMMHIPVLGIVENMSYFECPDCGSRHNIFGESHVDDIAEKHGITNVVRIPVAPKLTAAVDGGMIEMFEGDWLDGLADYIVQNG